METLGLLAIAAVCLVASNVKTWRIAERKGIAGTLETLKEDGVFDYLEE